MKSDLQLFYEERMWADGMPAFDELNDEERNSFESLTEFAVWQLAKSFQNAKGAMLASFKFQDGSIVLTKHDGEFEMPNRLKKN